MTSREFKIWRQSHGFTQDQAADRLGVPVNSIAGYERSQGEEPLIIPEFIEQACDALDQKRAKLRLRVKDKIREKIRSGGAPGSITPEILQEILLEIVDAM